MSTFETALKFWCCPLSGGGLRRLPHLSHSKSAPGYSSDSRIVAMLVLYNKRDEVQLIGLLKTITSKQ